MAEFSKEFIIKKGWEGWEPDFSILDIFQRMKEDEIVERICEGFGFIAIKKKNNQCILIFRDSEMLATELISCI